MLDRWTARDRLLCCDGRGVAYLNRAPSGDPSVVDALPSRVVAALNDAPSVTVTRPRLHPESWRTLRQLAKLHGTRDLIAALRSIAQESNT